MVLVTTNPLFNFGRRQCQEKGGSHFYVFLLVIERWDSLAFRLDCLFGCLVLMKQLLCFLSRLRSHPALEVIQSFLFQQDRFVTSSESIKAVSGFKALLSFLFLKSTAIRRKVVEILTILHASWQCSTLQWNSCRKPKEVKKN